MILLGVILGLGCGPAKNAGTTPAKKSIPFPYGELVVPAVFSLNNVAITPFCITVKEDIRYSSFTVSIYNRWGQKVWSADKQSACWDGTMIGTKDKTTVPQGVYYLVIEATTAANQIYKHTATLKVV